jgi:hypothetical protein
MSVSLGRGGDPLARHSLSPVELKELLAAERTAETFLAFKDADDRLGIFFPGRTGELCRLGRRPELDLSIGWDNEVSGLHAELQGIGGEWAIVDDGLSTNGTFVNEARVAGRQRLQNEDRIRIGTTVFAFRAGEAEVLQKTTPAGYATPAAQELTDTQRRVLVALCRPYRDGGNFATPATNQQIAEEVFLGVDAVKMHLRRLFAKFELADIPQNEKRAKLAESVLQFGVISERDLGS